MNGSANTYVGKRPIVTVTLTASPAARRITRPNSKLVISYRAGTQCIGGKLTMSDHNALPAIFTPKENSGFLAEILTCKTPDELRSLCEQRTRQENSRLQNYETYMIITGMRPYESRSERMSRLSQEQRQKYDELREQRNALLNAGPDDYPSNGKDWRWNQFQRINKELYQLTGHNGYNYGHNT
jgi:hypothetical protein